MKHKIIYIFAIILFVLLVIFVFGFRMFSEKETITKTAAQNTDQEITSQEDWSVGTLSNIDAGVGGTIVIDDKSVSALDLSAIYLANPNAVTVDIDEGRKTNLFDGSTATIWGSYNWTPTDFYWQIDLGNANNLSKVRLYNFSMDWYFKIQTSENGSDFDDATGWVGYANPPDWADYVTEASNVQFVKLLCSKHTAYEAAPPGVAFGEIEIYTTASATHTSGATQIDGGENFWEWETFTPSQDVPENTTLTYRFRSSIDGSDWGSWSGYQTYSGEAIDISELVTSRDGDDKYRYLQVESKFTSADGVSTPTLSDYTIGYHINRAPNTPTAATAVIAD